MKKCWNKELINFLGNWPNAVSYGIILSMPLRPSKQVSTVCPDKSTTHQREHQETREASEEFKAEAFNEFDISRRPASKVLGSPFPQPGGDNRRKWRKGTKSKSDSWHAVMPTSWLVCMGIVAKRTIDRSRSSNENIRSMPRTDNETRAELLLHSSLSDDSMLIQYPQITCYH